MRFHTQTGNFLKGFNSFKNDIMIEKTYREQNYVESLADTLIEEVGMDEVRRRFVEYHEHMKIGNTPNCISLYKATMYLNDQLKRKERKALEKHLEFCDGCSNIMSHVIQRDNEHQKTKLPVFAYQLWATQALSDIEKVVACK